MIYRSAKNWDLLLTSWKSKFYFALLLTWNKSTYYTKDYSLFFVFISCCKSKNARKTERNRIEGSHSVLPDLGFSAQIGLLTLCLGCKIFIWALGVFWAIQGFCLGLFGIFWALGSIWFLRNFEFFFSKWPFWKHFWPIWNYHLHFDNNMIIRVLSNP